MPEKLPPIHRTSVSHFDQHFEDYATDDPDRVATHVSTSGGNGGILYVFIGKDPVPDNVSDVPDDMNGRVAALWFENIDMERVNDVLEQDDLATLLDNYEYHLLRSIHANSVNSSQTCGVDRAWGNLSFYAHGLVKGLTSDPSDL